MIMSFICTNIAYHEPGRTTSPEEGGEVSRDRGKKGSKNGEALSFYLVLLHIFVLIFSWKTR